MESAKTIYILFADLLDYPNAPVKQKAAECVEVLSTACPVAVEGVAKFQAYLEQESQARIEETYTKTFDLQGTAYPYIGHYLFGESYKRSWFMARLSQEYREKGFVFGGELPDHVTVVLRFLSQWNAGEFSSVLALEGLKPAVDKMLAAFGDGSTNPYRWVLQGLAQFLLELNVESLASLADTEMGGLSHA